MKTLALAAAVLALCPIGCREAEAPSIDPGAPVVTQPTPGPVFATKPRQAEMVDLVWRQIYGMGEVPPPDVYWVEGAELDCPLDPGKGWKFADPTRCMYGKADYYSWPGGDYEFGVSHLVGVRALVAVAWRDALNLTIKETVLAHELCHAKVFAETGNSFDDAHLSPCFTPNGGLVEQARLALLAADPFPDTE